MATVGRGAGPDELCEPGGIRRSHNPCDGLKFLLICSPESKIKKPILIILILKLNIMYNVSTTAMLLHTRPDFVRAVLVFAAVGPQLGKYLRSPGVPA